MQVWSSCFWLLLFYIKYSTVASDVIIHYPLYHFVGSTGGALTGISSTTGLNYKALQGSSKYKFGVLAKIVNHMRVSDYESKIFILHHHYPSCGYSMVVTETGTLFLLFFVLHYHCHGTHLWSHSICIDTNFTFLVHCIVVILFFSVSGWFQVRHQQGDTFPLSFEELLDETNQLDISHTLKNWLINEVCHPGIAY